MRNLRILKLFFALTLVFSVGVSTGGAFTHVVTDLDGGTGGSLRNTLLCVVPGDVVTFQEGLSGTIDLTGSILLEKNLTIQGPGADLITISGSLSTEEEPLIMINSGVTAEISGLSFIDSDVGIQYGGAIWNAGNLRLSECLFQNNQADSGGAICNETAVASMDIFDCRFLSNSAYKGGAIYNFEGSLSVESCDFTGNEADGYGGGISNNESSSVVTNCTFSENTSMLRGGGMYNYKSSPTVDNCNFSSNIASPDSSDQGYGGGMYNNDSSPTVTNCTFDSNSAAYDGGGMYNYESSPTVTNCTFDLNSVSYGGAGMFNGESSPIVTNCTFSSNTVTADDGYGGGMDNHLSSSPIVTNCTFYSNTADNGSGMYNYQSSPTVTNSTFHSNTADNGSGMYNWQSSNSIVTNCIFWDEGDEIYNRPDNKSSTPHLSFCVVQNNDVGDGTISSDITSADPVLQDLADNGGLSETCALGIGSSAIDAGTANGAADTDQRGVSRPQGEGYDIGAFERELVTYTITSTSSSGGGISPESADVPEGTDQVFTINPFDGYVLSELLDGGISVLGDVENNTYTFINVTSDHTLSATFAIDTAMTDDAGVGEFKVIGEGIGSINSSSLVPEEDITALEMEGITSEDVQKNLEDGDLDMEDFVAGVSFDVTYSNDEGAYLLALDVTVEISREDLSQETCDAIDAGDDLETAFFDQVSIYKIVSPDVYDLFEVASSDQDLVEPVDFFEITSDDNSYNVFMNLVIEDKEASEGEDAVLAAVEGLDNYFYVYDGTGDGHFRDPVVALRKTAEVSPPPDDDDDDDSTAAGGGGGGSCSLGTFPVGMALLLSPLFLLFKR